MERQTQLSFLAQAALASGKPGADAAPTNPAGTGAAGLRPPLHVPFPTTSLGERVRIWLKEKGHREVQAAGEETPELNGAAWLNPGCQGTGSHGGAQGVGSQLAILPSLLLYECDV